MSAPVDTLVQPAPPTDGSSWWSSTSWFSGGADTPAWPGLQHSSGRDDANAAAAAGANAGDAEVARVGGAGAQNRFAGNTAVPVGTTPAKDSNCLETTGWAAGMTAHGPPVGGAVAHSRFNDRKRGKGHTCDGTAPPLSRPTGHQASVWAFNMASWSWEHTSNGAKIEAHVAGDTPVTFCPPGAPVNQALAAPPQPVSGAQEAPRRARGRAGHPGAAVGAPRGAGFAGCGGLVAQKGMLRELAVLPLRFPGAFRRLGAHAIDGVLLKGPPGSGKTMLGVAVAGESGAHLVVLTGADVAAGEGAAQKLKDAFAEAQAHAPSVLLLDELIAAVDKLQQEGGASRVVVLATSSRPEAVDPALRRHGRLGHEVLFGPLPTEERAEVLAALTKAMPLADDVDLAAVAGLTGGRVAADLAGVATDAALVAVREAADRVEDTAPDGPSLEALLEEIVLEQCHFLAAVGRAPPSGLRGWALPEVPKVKWTDLGGLAATKRELQELICMPMRYPEKYAAYGMRPSSGALLYGPPGCGKTMLAKAVAACSGANFISIRGPELLDKWLGGSEARVRALFEAARQAEPCVLFFDELDALAGRRSETGSDPMGARVLNQILTEIDGVQTGRHVFVLGATNRPEILDPAIMRPGRLDAMIKVPLPDAEGRQDILRSVFARWPVPPAVDIEEMAEATEGMSGADVVEMCRAAATAVIKDSIAHEAGRQTALPCAGVAGLSAIPAGYISSALASARRSVSAEEMAKYDELEAALKGKLDGDGRAFVERMVRGVEEGRLGELNRKLDDAEAALASERARTQVLEAALRSAGLAVPMQVDV
eukprot:jgi/Tetstr1/438612/TSEL_027163.t1